MERDFGAELDQMKEELREIKRSLSGYSLPRIKPAVQQGEKEVLPAEGNEKLNDLRDQLMAYTSRSGESGALAYTGTFISGDAEHAFQSVWVSAVPTDFLLRLNETHIVEKVLSSIGNSQRLAIVLSLLKRPMTVNQLMEALGANTTGQMYHHLKSLVSADIVKEEKGVYSVIPHRVQGIIMLLAGVSDLTDTRYTNGTWDERREDREMV